MRIIALIDKAEVIERILRHLKLWIPAPVTRSAAGPDPPFPKGETLPLTYHPPRRISLDASSGFTVRPEDG